MNRIRCVVIGLIVLFCSCRGGGNLVMSTFHDLPKGLDSLIDGCGCGFSGTEEELKKGSNLMLGNFDSTVVIMVDSKFVVLKLIQTDLFDNKDDSTGEVQPGITKFNADDFNAIYGNEEYKLTIKAKMVKDEWEESESFSYQGEMKLEDKKGRSVTTKVVGSCGC